MKIAIISDTHFGVRNDSPVFLNYILDYFEKIFFPYLVENNIKNVIHMGDVFDRRKYINFNTLAQVKKRFISKFKEHDITMHVTLGNHDVFFRNSNEINSVKELFSDGYDNIKIYENPSEIVFDGMCIGIVPWITTDNFDECINFINNNTCSILCGHFEINGFEVISGIRHEGGVESFLFNNYEKVFSGHFHLRQTHKNIHYLGTQYQMSFGDVGSKKGFSVFDTNTREIEFIENKNNLFYTLRYDDSSEDYLKALKKVKYEKYINSFIKIIVINKKNPKLFDNLVDSLNSVGILGMTIVEDSSISSKLDDSEVDVSEDTITIISKEIDSMEDIKDKNKLKLIIKDLYMESLSI
jgi:DNA repair exonuclease SbcCD nuclease subunit